MSRSLPRHYWRSHRVSPSFLAWIVTPISFVGQDRCTSSYLSIFIVLFLTSPFNGLLAEKVVGTGNRRSYLRTRTPVVRDRPVSPLRFPTRNTKAVSPPADGLPVVIVSAIPGLSHLRHVTLDHFPGLWMMSLQFIDYPMDNHRLTRLGKHARPAVLDGERLSGLVSLSHSYRESRYSTSHSYLQR